MHNVGVTAEPHNQTLSDDPLGSDLVRDTRLLAAWPPKHGKRRTNTQATILVLLLHQLCTMCCTCEVYISRLAITLPKMSLFENLS